MWICNRPYTNGRMIAVGSKLAVRGMSSATPTPNYEGNLDINNVVIPKPVQTKSRQTGITVPKIILAGSHLGSAYSFHILPLQIWISQFFLHSFGDGVIYLPQD